ncbi:calcium-independent phospholipase A2-gamma-like [Pholidichthys leucotaenia]
MGRYLSTNLCSRTVNGTSNCKIRYTMSLLRKHHHLAKGPRSLDVHRYLQLSPLCLQPSWFARKAAFKSVKHNATNSTSYCSLRDFQKEANLPQIVRFYSSSKGDAYKAPVGIIGKDENSFLSGSLGGHLGQSFNKLSRHINIYFKKNSAVELDENASFVFTNSEYPCRTQSSHSQGGARGQNISKSKVTAQDMNSTDKQEGTEASDLTQEASGLQLFHISTLATRFGESYNYVAHHINSVFSQGFAKVQQQKHLESVPFTREINRRQKKRKLKNTSTLSQVKLSSEKAAVELNGNSTTREDGYLLFARHINKYFGAKSKDNDPLPEEKNSTHEINYSTESTSKSHSTRSQQGPSTTAETGGLFHSSCNTTNFGESYFQTSSHVNRYFKRQEQDEGTDRSHYIETEPGSSMIPETLKIPSFVDYLRHSLSAISDLSSAYQIQGTLSQDTNPKAAMKSLQATLNKKLALSQREAKDVTRGLISNLRLASSAEDLTVCVEALNEHLIHNPSCISLIWKEKTAVTLLKQRRTYCHHNELQAALRETLSLIGYVDPVKGRGIRVLSIDGGGTRGVVPLKVLKLLEDETGKKIHQLFDYICGVSTGAILAFMLGLARFSVEECADMYRRFGSEVFQQNRLVGTVKMGWSHSYYNTETWEKILQEKLGHKVLIKTARDEMSPKVSAVSTLVNWGASPKAFVFRNYNHKPGSLNRYAGGSGYKMWQAVRASSAAPGYFQEFLIQSDIHQDGGIVMNNPCALAVHESRLLWPNQPFQCVLSLGTGRYDNTKRGPATSTSLRAKISNLICSATDTEGVHTLLDDLLAPDVYFRLNPMLSAEVSLDENRPQALDQLQKDTCNYLERNKPKLAQLCLVLGAERSTLSKIKDWMNERV